MAGVKAKPLHGWDLSVAAARELQLQLAPLVCRTNEVREPPRLIAGVDISGADQQGETLGAVVVLRYPGLDVVEVAVARQRPPMPYIPGLLSFRESPVLLDAFKRLAVTPELVLVDGHGLAHPRRFGIACHLGLLLDMPTIGCAKSLLVGEHGPLGEEAGSTADLVDGDEVIGAALRTQRGRRPLFVSIGHKVDLPAAVRWAMACVGGSRVPEPTRLAHIAASGRPVMAAVR